MKLTQPLSIRAAVLDFGAGPGMGGTSEILFLPEGDRFVVYFAGSSGDAHERVGILPGTTEWRERITYLVSYAKPAHEDTDPASVRVIGAEGLEADMLALAWSGEAGCRAVETLLALDDSELSRMSADGQIATQECVDGLMELDELLVSDTEAIVAAIRVVLKERPFSWHAAVSEAERIDAQLQVQEDAEAEVRRKRLSPFAAEIERLVANWWAFAGGSWGTHHHWKMMARQSAVRRFLERVHYRGALSPAVGIRSRSSSSRVETHSTLMWMRFAPSRMRVRESEPGPALRSDTRTGRAPCSA
jgi:hypothetical protein